MMRMGEAERRRLRALEAEKRAITKPHRDAARKARKVDQRAREKRSGKARRDLDETFLGWLREGPPCIACLVLGPARIFGTVLSHNPIEAAHQKLNAPSRGLQKRLGVRPSDFWCVPLCASHHRLHPPCCDPAQAKFWALVGLEPEQVADFCIALYGAFEQEADGAVIVREFAALAAGQRAEGSAC